MTTFKEFLNGLIERDIRKFPDAEARAIRELQRQLAPFGRSDARRDESQVGERAVNGIPIFRTVAHTLGDVIPIWIVQNGTYLKSIEVTTSASGGQTIITTAPNPVLTTPAVPTVEQGKDYGKGGTLWQFFGNAITRPHRIKFEPRSVFLKKGTTVFGITLVALAEAHYIFQREI